MVGKQRGKFPAGGKRLSGCSLVKSGTTSLYLPPLPPGTHSVWLFPEGLEEPSLVCEAQPRGGDAAGRQGPGGACRRRAAPAALTRSSAGGAPRRPARRPAAPPPPAARPGQRGRGRLGARLLGSASAGDPACVSRGAGDAGRCRRVAMTSVFGKPRAGSAAHSAPLEVNLAILGRRGAGKSGEWHGRG